MGMPKDFVRLAAFLTVLLPSSATAVEVVGHNTDPMNVPLLAGPGQTRIAASFGPGGSGIHLHGGVAVSRRWALAAAAAYADLNNCSSCTISERRHGEASLGYFRYSPTTGRVLEAYAGAGVGRFRMTGNPKRWAPQPEEMRVTAGHYEQYHAQADFGRRTKWSDWSGAVRLAAYRFTGFSLRDGNGDTLPVATGHWGLYVEPAYVYRLGYRWVKAELQAGLSLPVVQADGLDNNKVWGSFGLGLDLFRN